jgi:hypothetical protein
LPSYTVAENDCFDSISKANNFYNYRTIYDAGSNATDWPNANQLVVGGTVNIPAKTTKKFKLLLDGVVKAVLKRKKTKMRIVAVDADFKAIKVDACKATIDIEYPKKPEANGLLNLSDIDPAINDGSLVLTPAVPKPPKAKKPKKGAAPPKPDPKAYPIAIVEKDFEDKDPEALKLAAVEWTLNIGQLEPHTTIRGVLQRLVNLGFTCPVQTNEDADTAKAVSAYQLNVQGEKKGDETGVVADIRDHIKDKHDKL